MMKVLYVELADDDHAALERLTADTGAAQQRPVSISEVVRQLVRDASAKGKPVRFKRPSGQR